VRPHRRGEPGGSLGYCIACAVLKIHFGRPRNAYARRVVITLQ
jgi:hypothetical protein